MMQFRILPGNGSSFETDHLGLPVMRRVGDEGYEIKFSGGGETAFIEGDNVAADLLSLFRLRDAVTEVLYGPTDAELTDEEIDERMEDGVVTANIRDSLNHLAAGHLADFPFNAVAVANVVGVRNLHRVIGAEVEVIGSEEGDVLMTVRVRMKD